jgi:F-type H+-transporting ATPase subunit b
MDSTFWAFIALLLFIALIVYLKVPGMIGRSLDERAENIKKELEEARTLREEAQQLLAESPQAQGSGKRSWRHRCRR